LSSNPIDSCIIANTWATSTYHIQPPDNQCNFLVVGAGLDPRPPLIGYHTPSFLPLFPLCPPLFPLFPLCPPLSPSVPSLFPLSPPPLFPLCPPLSPPSFPLFFPLSPPPLFSPSFSLYPLPPSFPPSFSLCPPPLP
jgi:hypothetical protein